jgi:hypothetical protein
MELQVSAFLLPTEPLLCNGYVSSVYIVKLCTNLRPAMGRVCKMHSISLQALTAVLLMTLKGTQLHCRSHTAAGSCCSLHHTFIHGVRVAYTRSYCPTWRSDEAQSQNVASHDNMHSTQASTFLQSVSQRQVTLLLLECAAADERTTVVCLYSRCILLMYSAVPAVQ